MSNIFMQGCSNILYYLSEAFYQKHGHALKYPSEKRKLNFAMIIIKGKKKRHAQITQYQLKSIADCRFVDILFSSSLSNKSFLISLPDIFYVHQMKSKRSLQPIKKKEKHLIQTVPSRACFLDLNLR